MLEIADMTTIAVGMQMSRQNRIYAATINIYKSIQNYTYLHCDVPRKTSSCFIASDFAVPKDRLLSFDITLHRL